MTTRADVTIGSGVTLGDGAILGAVGVRGITARDPGTPLPVYIGPGSHVGHHAVIYAGCTLGNRCLLGDGSNLYVNTRLGHDVRIGRSVTISYGAEIGDGVIIMDGTHITGLCVIGSRSFIGPNVTTMNDPDPRLPYDPKRLNPPYIGADVLIGGGAIIWPGVTIGDGAKIAAGAIVARDVPAGATIVGAAGRAVPGGGDRS